MHPLLIVDATPADSDLLIGRLTLLGAEGIEERDGSTLHSPGSLGLTLIAGFEDWESAHAALKALEGEYTARIETLSGDEWRDAWKEHWRPTRISPSIVVVPSWLEYTPEPGDRVLKLDPGRAFGTGQHPSTTMVARALERVVPRENNATIIDIGCGSGILSFCAMLLGCRRAIGCDLDPDAVSAARENAAALGLSQHTEFRAGSVACVTETATVVVANIEASVLVSLRSELCSRVAPKGTLVLSGILFEQREWVEAAFLGCGFTLTTCESEGGWIAPEFVRSAAAP